MHILNFYNIKNNKIRQKNIRQAISKKHRKRNKSNKRKEKNHIYKLRSCRKILLKNLHSEYSYSKEVLTIKIDTEFGIEDDSVRNNFLDFAEKIIDFDNKELIINIQNSTRIWPSGITLLCSLKEWVEFAAFNNHIDHPLIRSTDSKTDCVNYYLSQCGFYDYVGRTLSNEIQPVCSDEHIVQIKRETKKGSIEVRENEISKLLQKVTKYSPDEIELFDSIVLTEVFLNVQEHGVVCNDQGWWVMAQYHQKHKFVSLSIADNGIGFRHSIITGPQGGTVINKLENSKNSDGKFIKAAIFNHISGAYNAISENSAYNKKKSFIRGARRGNGLQRIKEACIDLKIAFSLLSHYGYIFFDKNGHIIDAGSRKNRIFGGTLYHFTIPTEGVQ